MKKRIYRAYVVFLLPLLILAACTKDERLLYSAEPAIYFYKNVRGSQSNADSLAYSFATQADDVERDTVYMYLRVMGLAADRDRQVNIQPEDGATAKAGYHYNLGSAVVPAGSYSASVPVYLFRRPGMQDSIVSVMFGLQESADFKLGFPDNPRTSYAYDRLHYKLSITDQLLKPSNWESVWQSMFGTYSEVKFRFLIQATGHTNWNSFPFPQDQRFLVQRAKLALLEYQQKNGPLIDEFNEEVFFP